MFIYVCIFFCKIIEDALSTLRIIVVSNGKKIFGAILQFVIALIWIFVTSTVIINLEEDPYKILFFALGSLVGSYVGSLIEEKIAFGDNILMVEIEESKINNAIRNIKNKLLNITKIKLENKTLLILTCRRKNSQKIINSIKKEGNGIILSEKVKIN